MKVAAMRRYCVTMSTDMLKRFLIRWLVNGVGLWLAGELIAGVSYNDDYWVVLVAALIFSVVNAFIRPILIVLTLPVIILTLGLFTLFINTFILFLVTYLYPAFTVATFGAGVLTVIIIWVVNFAVETLVKE